MVFVISLQSVFSTDLTINWGDIFCNGTFIYPLSYTTFVTTVWAAYGGASGYGDVWIDTNVYLDRIEIGLWSTSNYDIGSRKSIVAIGV